MSLLFLPTSDSEAMAEARRAELDLDRRFAAELGRSAVTISERGWYENSRSERVEIGDAVARTISGHKSFRPEALLPEPKRPVQRVTRM